MHKLFKKSIALLLVAVMAMSFVPLAGLFLIADAVTVPATPEAIVLNSTVTWQFDDETGTLTLGGTGAMANWTSAKSTPWYNKSYGEDNALRVKIEKVVIGKDITTIGNYAFSSCSTLKEVVFEGNSITSIGDNAFFGCSKLTAIAIPASVTEINANAFANTGITAVAVPKGVTSLSSGVFEGCKALTEVTFDKDSKLKEVNSWAFNGCSALKSIVLPSTVTFIDDYVFSGCSAATTITIPAGVTDIGDGNFTGCKSLTAVTLPAATREIGDNYFKDCSSLKSIAIPANVEKIGVSAFEGCSALETITFAAGSKLKTIGARAFYGCSKLGAFAVPASVVSIGYDASTQSDYVSVFDRCVSIKSFTVDAKNTKYSSDATGVLYNKAKTVIYRYPTGSDNKTYTVSKNVTEIKPYAFESCAKLESIVVDKDNANYASNAKMDVSCLFSKDLTTFIAYPAGNPSDICVIIGGDKGVRAIASRAFSDCKNLTKFIHVPATVPAEGFAEDFVANLPKSCSFCCDDSNIPPIMGVAGKIGYQYTKCNKHCVHNFISDPNIPDVEATCTNPGIRTRICSKCGDIQEEKLPQKAHTFGPETIEKDEKGNNKVPTCIVPVSAKKVCVVCGETSSRLIYAEHKFVVSTDPKKTYEATCTEPGQVTKECSVCDKVEVTNSPELGHDFGEWSFEGKDENGNVIDTNNAPGKAGTRSRICNRCGEKNTQPLAALPSIVIAPQTATDAPKAVYKGDDLVLVCEVKDLGSNVVAWSCKDADADPEASAAVPSKYATLSVDPDDATKCTVTAIGNGNIIVTAKVVTSSGAAIKDGRNEEIAVEASLECRAKMNFWHIIVAFFRNIKEKLSLSNIIGGLVG